MDNKISQEQFDTDFNKMSASEFKEKYGTFFSNTNMQKEPPVSNINSIFEPTTTGPVTPNQPEQPSYVPQNMGWVCPKCGAVHAPWVQSCPNCAPPRQYEVWCGTKPNINGDPNLGRGYTISANGACSISNTPNQRYDCTTTKGKIYDPCLDINGRPLYG
jgi:hypothetical protein